MAYTAHVPPIRLSPMSKFQLTAEIIEERLKILMPSEHLIYEVLSAYGFPKSSISRLKTGDYNIAKGGAVILWRRVLYYAEVLPALLEETAAAVLKNSSILRQKPRFIIVSDGSRWLAYDSKKKESRMIELSTLYKQHDFFLPWAGIEKATITVENPADIRAAQRMGKLFDAIRRDNNTITPHDLNVFMTRLLFCLFAEDSGIFEGGNIFTNLIASISHEDGSDLQFILERLFKIMNIPENAPARNDMSDIYRKFPYVNGGLFSRFAEVPVFSPKSRQAIIDAGSLDWAEINTDIFGNMFQACLDQNMRQTLGEHYTSVPNIMKVLGPLFLDELKEAAETAKGDQRAVEKLIIRMRDMRFFDPACGSGNFLLIAFKELRRVEMDLLESIQDQVGYSFEPSIGIHQFYGIEIDDLAHEIATLSMWLVEHQMNQEFRKRLGREIPTLPLKKNENIVLGNALRIDWKDVCPIVDDTAAPLYTLDPIWQDKYKPKLFEVYVFGNPPYAGYTNQSGEQKADMEHVFSGWDKYSSLDYVACWFKLASDYIGNGCSQCAFVSTNSITQGEQVSKLWPEILKQCGIAFAYTSFKWSNNAKYKAGVTCVIIGLAPLNCMPGNIALYTNGKQIQVDRISPYLYAGNSVYVSPSSHAISELPKITKGSIPVDGGNLIIEQEDYEAFLKSEPSAKRYIKQFTGSEEFIHGKTRYCLWLVGATSTEINSMPFVRDRVLACQKMRLNSHKSQTQRQAQTPHLMGEIRHEETEAIIIPSHSSENRIYIPIGFLEAGIVVSNAALVIYNAEPWVFAIISSAMHMAWMRATCGRLETRYRYSAKLCYNTFPVRELTPDEKGKLNEAAFEVLDIRQRHTEMTLGDMYQPEKMPEDLLQAHHRLDTLVDSLYRKAPFNNEEERLEYLFKLYKEMTS